MKHIIQSIFFLTLILAPLCTASAQEKLNQTDENGKRQGHWIKKYPNGQIMYEGYFSGDKPEGEFKRYDEDGNLTSVLNYSTHIDTVTACFYHPNGYIAGKGKYIREAIKWGLVDYRFLNPDCNDAAFWLYVYLYGGFGELDQQCKLTHQLYWGKDGDLTYNDEGQVFNTVTGSNPQFIHSNGHTWERIPKELVPPARVRRV